VGIGDGEALRLKEQAPRCRKQCLGKDHGRNRQGSQPGLSVIESLGVSSQITGKVALMIVGSFSKAIEPGNKSQYRRAKIFSALDVGVVHLWFFASSSNLF